MISKLLQRFGSSDHESRQAVLYRNFIRHEAKIGGQLFGEVPAANRREFFCLDEHTWVWHEEWTDEHSEHQARTTRYDIRPGGIYKAQKGQPYQLVSLEEARNLYRATILYERRINAELYNFV